MVLFVDLIIWLSSTNIHTALEASFVPFLSGRQHFLGGIHGLPTLGAFGMFHWRERHLSPAKKNKNVTFWNNNTRKKNVIFQWVGGWLTHSRSLSSKIPLLFLPPPQRHFCFEAHAINIRGFFQTERFSVLHKTLVCCRVFYFIFHLDDAKKDNLIRAPFLVDESPATLFLECFAGGISNRIPFIFFWSAVAGLLMWKLIRGRESGLLLCLRKPLCREVEVSTYGPWICLFAFR